MKRRRFLSKSPMMRRRALGLAVAALACFSLVGAAIASQTPYGPNTNPAPAGHVYGTTGVAPRTSNADAANYSGTPPYVEVWYHLQSGGNTPYAGAYGSVTNGSSNGKYAYAHCETTTGSPLGMACATTW